MRLPRKFAFLAVVLSLVVSACTGGSEDTTASETLEADSSTEDSTATTVDTSTTTTSTTTTTTSTVATVDPEEAVREVHTRFMTEFFARDERETSPTERLALAAELTTGPQLARSTETIEALAESGEYNVSPGYDSNIVEIEVNGEQATVLDCSQDRGERFSADGELVSPAEDIFRIRETTLVLVDGTWFVKDFFTGGGIECDPDV